MKKITLLGILLFNILSNAQNAGTLNNDFSENGWDTIYGHDNGFEVNKLIIQPDGRLLITAQANIGEGGEAVLVRYNADGTIDTSFGGGDGIIRTIQDQPQNANPVFWMEPSDTKLQSNGKIIVVGGRFYSPRIFRFNTDGTLDTSFNATGIAAVPQGNGDNIEKVGIQSNDKIIICGVNKKNINNILVKHIFIWRLMPDGILDTTFGNNGIIEYTDDNLLDGLESYFILNNLIVLPNDELLDNHTFLSNASSKVWLRKMTVNGVPDLSFGIAGNVIKNTPSNFGNYTYSNSAVFLDGSILSTFTISTGTNLGFDENVFKTNAQGLIDPDFNINISQGSTNPNVGSKIITHNNIFYLWTKTLASNGNDERDVIKCYDLNANLIVSFGMAGTALIDQNNIPKSMGGDFAIGSNGNIFISSAATSTTSGGNLFLIINVLGATNPLNLSDTVLLNQLTISPNPSTGIFNIQTENPIENATITVANLNGRIVYEVKSENVDNKTLDLNYLLNGIYILNISNSNYNYSQKLVKQ